MGVGVGSDVFAQAPPTCRLDNQNVEIVKLTILAAKNAYNTLGKILPFEDIVINPVKSINNKKNLNVYIVSDASISSVGKNGCISSQPALIKDENLDEISVKGGCIALASDYPEIRCSKEAIQVFSKKNNQSDIQNPALLYVLAHELAHILQRHEGEYSGGVETIELNQSKEKKLNILKESCKPKIFRTEEEADRLAVQVLSQLLKKSPYREPIFSEQGSVLWGVDQINLAANIWRKIALEREFISQKIPHKSFIPTEFPTPPLVIKKKSKQFVCDVLRNKKGFVYYPSKSTTHPPLENRMQRIAEELRIVAANLPKTGAKQEYKAVSIVQEQLSDIFTFIYKENGLYLEEVQNNICTMVNGDDLIKEC